MLKCVNVGYEGKEKSSWLKIVSSAIRYDYMYDRRDNIGWKSRDTFRTHNRFSICKLLGAVCNYDTFYKNSNS